MFIIIPIVSVTGGLCALALGFFLLIKLIQCSCTMIMDRHRANVSQREINQRANILRANAERANAVRAQRPKPQKPKPQKANSQRAKPQRANPQRDAVVQLPPVSIALYPVHADSSSSPPPVPPRRTVQGQSVLQRGGMVPGEPIIIGNPYMPAEPTAPPVPEQNRPSRLSSQQQEVEIDAPPSYYEATRGDP